MEWTSEQEAAAKRWLERQREKDPERFDLEMEFGRMLMRHISTFTPDELERYEELKRILCK